MTGDAGSVERTRAIRALLDQVGITEVTYHALRRNEAISFMPRRVKGQDGFSGEQLLALKAFALLRTYGLNSRDAAEAVEAAFPSMRTFVQEGKLLSEADYKVGVRLLALRGKIAVSPLAGPLGGAIEAGRIELDLRGISVLLTTRHGSAT